MHFFFPIFNYLCRLNQKLKIVKNLSLVLNIILLIAVVVLYILHFSGHQATKVSQINQDGTMPDIEGLTIAYVNSDSLLKNYDFFKDLEKKFDDKRDKLNTEYQNRAKGLQTEIGNYQQNAGNMTMNQQRAVEDNLRQKQQNLMQYQQQLSQQLAQEQDNMNSQIYDKVSDYLKNYGHDKKLNLVLTYTKGSGVLYANDSLNITDEVIAGLNQQYQAEQAPDKGKKTAAQKSVAKDSASVK